MMATTPPTAPPIMPIDEPLEELPSSSVLVGSTGGSIVVSVVVTGEGNK